MYTVLSVNAKYNYKSRICSISMLFVFIGIIGIVILPFIITYKSRGLWIGHNTLYEQPDINYNYRYVFIGYTDDADNPVICTSESIRWSSDLLTDRCISSRVHEIDSNKDHKKDKLIFELDIIAEYTYFKSIIVQLPVNYKILDCATKFESSIIIQNNINRHTNSFELFANVVPNYKTPFNCKSQVENLTFTEKITNKNIHIFIKSMIDKPEMMKLKNIFSVNKPGNGQIFSIRFTFQFPEIEMKTAPMFSQLLVFAWAQYFPVLMIIAWCIQKILIFIFESGSVPCIKTFEPINSLY